MADDKPKQLGFELFKVNEGITEDAKSSVVRFSEIPGAIDVASYASYFVSSQGRFGSNLLKANPMHVPPSVQSFANISYMPNAQTSNFGILQWPGLPPVTLERMAREHVGPLMIIAQRVDEVLRYSDMSAHPWRPGWQIVSRDAEELPGSVVKREMREAELFLLNSGSGKYEDARWRDSIYRVSFSKFLAEIVRNSLTFDGIAIWTDMDEKGQVLSYAPMPAQNIRLRARPTKSTPVYAQQELNWYGTNPDGSTPISMYNRQGLDLKKIPDENEIFAVAVDEAGTIIEKFTRRDLIWYTRNPRLDVTVGGYGYPEMEQALVLVTGFTNALQFNADIFDKNSIPKGLLTVKGNFSQKQLDALSRMWDDLQRGPRTDWSLPIIQLSEKGAIELISFEPLRKESAYYSNLVNMFMGALATVFRFPVHKLGYKISGTTRDMRPETAKTLEPEDDIGLPVLLTHLETVINEYILWTRWPHLKFMFTGKSPKEDARLYETKQNSMTLNEKRLLVGLRPLDDLVESPGAKEIAELLGLSPVDPALIGVYQAILAARAKSGNLNLDNEAGIGTETSTNGNGNGDGPGKDIKTAGPRMIPKKDPAESEKHGHMSGVRRDSRAEKHKDDAKAKTPPNLRLHSVTDYTRGEP